MVGIRDMWDTWDMHLGHLERRDDTIWASD